MNSYLVYVRFIIISNIYRSDVRAEQQNNLVPSKVGVELKLDKNCKVVGLWQKHSKNILI